MGGMKAPLQIFRLEGKVIPLFNSIHAWKAQDLTLVLERCRRFASRPCRLYLLTPWGRVHLEKLTGFAASQEIPRIYGTRKFITVFTSVRHLSLS
jgi:hypothetical protein